MHEKLIEIWRRVKDFARSQTTTNLIGGIAIGCIVVVGVILFKGFFLNPLVSGPLAFLVTMFLLSPFYALRSAQAFAEGKDWFIIFTFRKANRLMQRDKNGKPVDFVGLVPPGKTFEGSMPNATFIKDDPDYWKLLIEQGVQPPVWIRIHRFWFVRWWMRYINIWIDVVLVGVNGIFGVRRYEISKTRYRKIVVQDDDILGGRTLYEIIPPRPPENPEFSNHVRTAPFEWVVPIVGANTKDRLTWDMLIVVQMRCTNPWLQLNNHDNWSQFLSTTIVDAAVRGLRDLTIDDIVGLTQAGTGTSTSNDEGRDKIIASIYHANGRLEEVVGLCFDKTPTNGTDVAYAGAVQLLYLNPYFTEEAERLAFTQAWRAEEEAKAERTLGDAEAYRESTVITKITDALQDKGEVGIAVQNAQALENAAKHGNTILWGGNQPSSKQEQLLALLVEKLDRGGNNGRRNRRNNGSN